MSFKSYSFQARNYLLKNESQETYGFYKFFKSFRWIIKKKGQNIFLFGSRFLSPHQKNRELPEGGALVPWEDCRAQEEEERLLFFPGPDSVKSHGLYLLLPSQTSLSFLQKASPPFSMWESCTWFTIVSDPNCNSVLIPNMPIIAGEVTGNLFVSGQLGTPQL